MERHRLRYWADNERIRALLEEEFVPSRAVSEDRLAQELSVVDEGASWTGVPQHKEYLPDPRYGAMLLPVIIGCTALAMFISAVFFG
jgi:hypothetical protein